MGCIFIFALLGLPRIALIWVWLSQDHYLTAAYGNPLWALAGFFLLPYTTLAFAYGMNSLGAVGEMTPLGWLLTFIALAIDLGASGGGASQSRRRRRDD